MSSTVTGHAHFDEVCLADGFVPDSDGGGGQTA